MPYFVWTKTLIGPSPQIWTDNQRTQKQNVNVIGKPMPITEEQVDLGFEQLASLFPCPEVTDEPQGGS